ncbi:DEAD/DEAH box helicase [Streptomyces sp. NPDC002516]
MAAGQGTLDSLNQESAAPEAAAGASPAAVPRPRRPLFAPGTQVLVRDEQWLVKKVADTTYDGWMVEVTGVSSLVRGMDAVFYERLDQIDPLDPDKTRLVPDSSPNHRKARLYLEAVIRKTALPQTEHGLALAGNFLMDQQTHQLRPAQLALSMENPQPRVLVADVVGLGKTLEIGILLAELIRRGRGERILVVTPAHVLEQFQRELWTRFSIPLVRLDSTGIQRIQQDIPAGRNPFAYFKRAIISVDTLKSDVYAHHLENTEWDAVVIDESHNLVNRGTKNNSLARLLARRTDALVLASATPHNGDAESFAELIGMLDEAGDRRPLLLRREGPGAPLHPAHQDRPRGTRLPEGRLGGPRPVLSGGRQGHGEGGSGPGGTGRALDSPRPDGLLGVRGPDGRLQPAESVPLLPSCVPGLGHRPDRVPEEAPEGP